MLLDRDLNCNGTIDGEEDVDGDGYTKNNDCCDSLDYCRASREENVIIETPELINPAAYELTDDTLDNNCNGEVDEETSCAYLGRYDDAFPQQIGGENAGAALALARAMDFCEPLVTEASNKAGLITASIAAQTPGVVPQLGPSMAVLSTGFARDNAKRGDDAATSLPINLLAEIPEPYKTEHNGKLQSHPSCGEQTTLKDAVSLELRLRAPQNAKGFKFKFRFFTVEYPDFLCTPYNDFFLALLDSDTTENLPPDHNISFDAGLNPVSVNNAFFTSCTPISCTDDTACHQIMTCDTQAGLCKPADNSEPCADGADGVKAVDAIYPGHGGTAWLASTADVEGGSAFTLRFYLWDTGDQERDSTVLLDAFEWIYEETSIGTIIIDNPIN